MQTQALHAVKHSLFRQEYNISSDGFPASGINPIDPCEAFRSVWMLALDSGVSFRRSTILSSSRAKREKDEISLALTAVTLDLPAERRGDNQMHGAIRQEVHLAAVAVNDGVRRLQWSIFYCSSGAVSRK
ncbi:hypothetical protein [Chlorobaculum tepidum]|uniref:hypothetical protein n=1 Tax=Chlorobaculum tepidum TaxID=1097 RepID=UPI0013E8CBFB|nr:hypothetical protein [Chlorobaculum tepidum]